MDAVKRFWYLNTILVDLPGWNVGTEIGYDFDDLRDSEHPAKGPDGSKSVPKSAAISSKRPDNFREANNRIDSERYRS